MRIMIFEPRYKGHHFMYVRRLLDALAGYGSEIVIVTEFASARSVEFHQHLDGAITPYRLFERLIPSPTTHKKYFWQQHVWHRVGQLRDAITEVKPDHVYIPTADGMVPLVGVPFLAKYFRLPPEIPIEGNVIRCAFAYPNADWKQQQKNRILRAAAARCPFAQLHTIDFIAHDYLRSLNPALAQRLSILPDPLDTVPAWPKMEARRELGIPLDGRYIGSAGSFDRRKGLEPLMAAFVRLAPEEGVRLLLVGKIDRTIKQTLVEKYANLIESKRLIIFDNYVTDTHLSMALSAMDVVTAPYVNHIGPSGIVIRALSVERPVLVSDFGWCGQVVPRFKLGQVCDTNKDELFAQAIRQSLSEVEKNGFTLTPVHRLLLRFFSTGNFARIWRSRLRARMGLPPETDMLAWDKVEAAM